MLKRIICFLIATGILFCFASCGKREGELVSIFYNTYKDDYTNSVRSYLDKSLAKKGNIRFVNYNSGGDSKTQLGQIYKAVEEGSRVIAVNATDKSITQEISDIAKSREIGLIFFDRPVSDEAMDGYSKAVFVGYDYTELGRLQGELAGQYLLDNFEKCDINSDGKISYVLYNGDEESEDATERTYRCIDEADKVLAKEGKPAIEYYESDASKPYAADPSGKWSSDFAKNHMGTILADYKSGTGELPELVIANNDEMALGAISALREHGYNGSEFERTIPVFGIGGSISAENAVHTGLMTATVEPDSEKSAEIILKVIENYLSGKEKLSGVDRRLIKDGRIIKVGAVN